MQLKLKEYTFPAELVQKVADVLDENWFDHCGYNNDEIIEASNALNDLIKEIEDDLHE